MTSVFARITLELEKNPVSAKEPGLSGKIRTQSATSARIASNCERLTKLRPSPALRHERQRRRHVAADALPDERDAAPVAAEPTGVVDGPLEDGIRLLILRRIVGLRSGRVVDEDGRSARFEYQIAYHSAVGWVVP